MDGGKSRGAKNIVAIVLSPVVHSFSSAAAWYPCSSVHYGPPSPIAGSSAQPLSSLAFVVQRVRSCGGYSETSGSQNDGYGAKCARNGWSD